MRLIQKYQPNQMRRAVDVFGRRGGHLQLKEQLMIKRTSVAVIVLLICTISLFSTFNGTNPLSVQTKIGMDGLWGTAVTGGWRPSSAPGADWPPPPNESNGYLRVRCYGGLTQHRTAIGDAVLAARIMNATLVLPELVSFFLHDNSDFKSIYDVEHFIKSLRYDVRIVESLPEILTHGEMKKMEAYSMDPPPHAPLKWYATVALEKMKEHGAIYLTSFSHGLEEEFNNHEFQRLRCRVNYHALRFKPQLLKQSNMIVSKLRSQGQFLAIHLRFETNLVSQCYDIFTPKEQQDVFLKYRAFLPGRLLPRVRRALGECALTPEEVGLILRAMGFDSSTRIYLNAGEFFGGERYIKPFRTLFPHLENHSTVVPANEELAEKNTLSMLGSAVDYMVCIQADIFMPTYDGPDYFAKTVMGHRLYHGFRTTLQPERKALTPIFIDRKKEKKNGNAAAAAAGFEEAVRRVMFNTSKFGRPHKRRVHESFYTNPWPDCFCQISAPKTSSSSDNYCPVPPENVLEIVNSLPLGLQSEETPDNWESIKSSSNSTSYTAS